MEDTNPNADNAETRRCETCGEEKPLTTAHWKTSAGRPGGLSCKPCLKKRGDDRRKAENETRRELRAAGVPALQKLPTRAEAAQSVAAARQRAIVLAARLAAAPPTQVDGSARLDVTKMSVRKLTTALALKAAGDVINREAPTAWELIALYARDPESPHHTWALQLIADRSSPQRAFAALAIKEAGLEDKGGAKPSVTVNIIGGAKARIEEGRVIEVDELEGSEDADS
jgi:hypothetical protein